MNNSKEIIEIKKKYKNLIYVDIDLTICTNSKNSTDYNFSVPIQKRIEKINKLFDENNYIVYWTARGSLSGINWTELTHNQLKEWRCKYHRLFMKKPYYDLFIDDKNINSEEYFKDC